MALKGRKLWKVILLVIAFAWIGWNYMPRHADNNVSKPPAPAAASSAPAPAPAASVAPATWKVGTLTLHACQIGGAAHGGRGASVAAWCDKFDVPEDRAHTEGRHITLNLAIVRSSSEKPDADMVVLLAGGPGEAATRTAHIARAFPQLHRHHDFLLIDQRGTGGSNPLTCDVGGNGNPLAAFDPVTVRAQAKACLKHIKSHADPRFYTTTAAVADLEAVRKALGSPTFDLIGTSYGTRVALQYLRAHPDGVRAVVLDSPLPNQVVAGQDFARNLHAALAKDFALCTSNPECKKRFGDPMHSLDLLRQALAANPHQVATRDPWTFAPEKQPLTAQTLAGVVRLFAYARHGIELLPLSIDAAAHGDVGPMLGQYAQLSESLSAKRMANGMNWSVICAEDADLMQPRKADADTLLGNRIVKMYKAICPVWPHGTRPANFHQPDVSDKPVLILSGALDPVTPPAYGKMIAKHLSNARQLVFKGEGHAMIRVACARRLMSQFIRKPTASKLDTACMKRLTAPTFFLNFNGAAP